MNVVPDNFQRFLSRQDVFVAGLSFDDVQRVIIESDSHRRTESITSDFVRGLVDRYTQAVFGPESKVDRATYDQATRNIEAACCRRLAFAMMGVSDAPKSTE